MRNRLKTSIALATLLLVMVSSHAQNAIVNFGYDANGNRISRTLTVAKVEENGKSGDNTDTLDFITEHQQRKSSFRQSRLDPCGRHQ